MTVITTHRQIVYRLLPQKPSNWRWLDRTLEDQRQLYNAALAERIDCYAKTGKGRTYFDQCKALTECRRELPEMSGCSTLIQRGTLKRLDLAYRAFFRRVKAGQTAGFPRFKGREYFDSITILSGVKLRGNQLHVPAFGPITVRRRGGNPYEDAKPLSAVLKRTGGKWYATVCFEVEIEEPARNRRGYERPSDRRQRRGVPPGSRQHRARSPHPTAPTQGGAAANVITVPAPFTSQTCHECGAVDPRNRKSQAKFKCVACGHADHADLNAAANILALGIGATARGGCRTGGPMNREISARAA